MLKSGCGEQLSLLVQVFYDLRIRILHKFPPIGRLLRHISPAIHKLYQGQSVLPPHIGIILTEGRRNMHDTGAVRHCDIVVTSHIMGFPALAGRFLSRAGKQRLIFPVFQIPAGISLQNFISVLPLPGQGTQHGIQQGLCHIISIAVRSLYFYISLLRIHAQRHIGGQCPGCGRPGQEIGVLTHTFESGHGGTLLHRLVALGHLVAGQGSPAPGTVGHNLKALIQKSLVPDGL